jgi:ABC-type uncharacterized transport system fused permease/ATPase subunit
MKKAVYIAELILPGKPASAEILEASINITFNFLSAIIFLIFYGIYLLTSSTVLAVVFNNNIEPSLHLSTKAV